MTLVSVGAQTGFSVPAQETQLAAESLLLSYPQPDEYRLHLAQLTALPHLTGTPANEKVAAYIGQVMKSAGLEVEYYPYDIYMSKGPGDIEVRLEKPIRMPLNNREYILDSDPYSQNSAINPGWNSYSGSGEISAEIVYANYGTREDFERLKTMGVDVAGKIVIARYGGNFRGYKAKYAQAYGAAGLIIYTDPGDSGYMKGLEYPEGSWFSESTIQRGSLLTLDYTGDPLTPNVPALPLDSKQKIARLDPATVPFHTIPVTPLPYGAAREILSRMKGKPVPGDWQGGLPFTYRIEGGADLKVFLKVKQEKGYVRANNVIGTLRGSEYPDEWIIIGSHYDAWEYGASDPNSGTAMLLSLAEALGKLSEAGFRPKRSIKIAHWDAEEHGILGSTEWVEQLRDELSRKTLAYCNADGAVSGVYFGGASAPTLKQLMIDATKAVPYLNSSKKVYEHWMERSPATASEPGIGNLGGGSDHLPFYAHVGIPSLSLGMGGPTLYHSAYDNFNWYKKFADSSFTAGPTVTKVMGILALRMANAEFIPYEVSRYSRDLTLHVSSIEKKIQRYAAGENLNEIVQAIEKLAPLCTRLDAALKNKLVLGTPNKALKDKVNAQLIQLERSFITTEGMPFGSWFKSLYACSDPYSGYASWMLPGLEYLVANKQVESLPAMKKAYVDAIYKLQGRIEAILKELE